MANSEVLPVSLAGTKAKNKQFCFPCGMAHWGAGSDMLPVRRGLYKRHKAFPITSETTKSVNCGSTAEDMVLVSFFLIPSRTYVLKYTDYQK